jgi:hypothetical protein
MRNQERMIEMLPKPRFHTPRIPARSGPPLAALLGTLLAACTQPLVVDQSLPQQIATNLAENACFNRCQATKDACDGEARFDYAQCQAGYSASFRDYRRCLASSTERCGYPWWSCSENNYGYCSNRYWECRDACRKTHRGTT